uniref:ATP synthase complex subunit 8 n=1 Tax=Austrolebias charrua TaxID=308057 RepID=A0A0R7A0V8_9TELE|nr:ATP synthase F0 subunit 8 [Austrolebias charrua]AKL82656.1 ATP synthase subunit 8 [Austrolebias charrua]
MPQLNPSPWFLILSFAWLTFLLLAPSKILTHAYPFQPVLKNMKKFNVAPWNWLWQ